MWKVETGQCLRRFDKAHVQGVTCVAFARDGTQLVTGSFDSTVRIHGLKSGKTLKELRGHTTFVNDVRFSPDGNRIYSASSDGHVRVWEVRTSECVQSFRPRIPGEVAAITEATRPPLHTLLPVPRQPDHLVVGERSATVYIMTTRGQPVATMTNGKAVGADFTACALSSRGALLLCIGEDSNLYCFELDSGKLVETVHVHDKEVVGLAVHPHLNLVATYALDGEVRLWKP